MEIGNRIMGKIFDELNHLERTEEQKEIHLGILSTLVKFIYGAHFREYEDVICEKWGFKSVGSSMTLVSHPNPELRTECVAQLIAVLSLHVPGIGIKVFTPGHETPLIRRS
jgi:hypothetical protein